MRRILAITLIAVFGWMFVAPLLPAILPSVFGLGADEASLPACCRRAGKHHCALENMAVAAAAASRSFGRLTEKCPYPPRANAAAPPFSSSPLPNRSVGEAVVERPHAFSQVEANYRIVASRSHRKRGPPAFLL